MKIIDKVLDEYKGLDRKDTIEYKCPEYYGFKYPALEECRKMSCEECWNREVEE